MIKEYSPDFIVKHKDEYFVFYDIKQVIEFVNRNSITSCTVFRQCTMKIVDTVLTVEASEILAMQEYSRYFHTENTIDNLCELYTSLPTSRYHKVEHSQLDIYKTASYTTFFKKKVLTAYAGIQGKWLKNYVEIMTSNFTIYFSNEVVL